MSNDESLQKTALEAGAVKKLTQIVTMTDCDKNGSAERQEKLLENCLLAMASLALKKEESRKQVTRPRSMEQSKSCDERAIDWPLLTGLFLFIVDCRKQSAATNCRSSL